MDCESQAQEYDWEKQCEARGAPLKKKQKNNGSKTSCCPDSWNRQKQRPNPFKGDVDLVSMSVSKFIQKIVLPETLATSFLFRWKCTASCAAYNSFGVVARHLYQNSDVV